MSGLLNPDTPPIGRQPEQLVIVPSRAQPWYGKIVEGRRFTTQQDAALLQLAIDIPTAEALTVKRQATNREAWWPTGALPPVYAFECPVIGKRADGRIKIIAPNGDAKLVQADGWAHRPYRRPTRQF